MLEPKREESEDLLLVFEDEPKGREPAAARSWRVLVVDDDDDIHEATRYALKRSTILDRPVELLHARSAAEAWTLVRETQDIAVALIDVVMETPDAGLHLVRELRESGYCDMRIVLRTGQPGYAPERSVISTYEIDDYRTKAELTQLRLLTVLTAAIRAYEHISTITRSRAGLEMIVQSASKLFQRTNLELFSRGVLTQIASLLRIEPNGIVCVAPGRGMTESDGQIVSAAGRFTPHLGRPLAGLVDSEILEILDEARDQPAPILRGGYLAMRFECESGRELTVLIETDCEIPESDLALLKLFSINIAVGFENLALVEKLDRLAYLDPVLEVPNLNAFQAALQTRLDKGVANYRVALMSVDAFQSVVAAHGPQVAHGFLAALYTALTSLGGSKLTVARVGDGTFALLGDRATLDEDLVPKVVGQTYHIDGIEVATTATTAISDLDGAGEDPPSIMQLASSALMHIRQTQPGKCVAYSLSMRAGVERQIDLQRALKQALDHGEELKVHLQPKVNLATGEVVGAEALLRWQHQDEPIPPSEFIPIAESVGLTQQLTELVIHQIGQWAGSRNGAKPLPVAVNLSMVDLNNPGFAARILDQIAAAGLDPEKIEFEVTEGIAMQDTPWAINQVQSLNDAGYRIALDDFGTGYSSLGHFDRLPIDILKIDRSFITPLEIRTARNSLAAIVLAMTQALNVDCVAEGIESAEKLQALLFLGCPVGQGYHFGRPVQIDQFDGCFLSATAH